MTQPVPVGFPDFGRFAARTTKLYISTNVMVPASNTTIGTFFVGDVPYVRFTIVEFLNNDRVRIIIDFFDDANLTNNIGAYGHVVTLSGFADGTLPVLGPFMRVRVRSNTITTEVFVSVSGTWVPSIPWGALEGGTRVFEVNQSIAAGASLGVDSLATRAVQASYALQASAGPARVVLQMQQLDGTFNVIHRDAAPGGVDTSTGLVFTPPGPLRASLFNDHTAANVVRFNMIERPGVPGA